MKPLRLGGRTSALWGWGYEEEGACPAGSGAATVFDSWPLLPSHGNTSRLGRSCCPPPCSKQARAPTPSPSWRTSTLKSSPSLTGLQVLPLPQDQVRSPLSMKPFQVTLAVATSSVSTLGAVLSESLPGPQEEKHYGYSMGSNSSSTTIQPQFSCFSSGPLSGFLLCLVELRLPTL